MLLQRKPSKQRLPSKGSGEKAHSEDQFRTIFERLPHPAWILDRATLRILAVNEAAIALYGYSRAESLDRSYVDLHVPEEANDVRVRLEQPSSARGFAHWRQRAKSGVALSVEAAWRPVPFDLVPAILLTAQATDRGLGRLLQETEEGRERLEVLSRRLVEIQEVERSEIARELHDEIGQLLTGLKLMIDAGAAADRLGGEAPEARPPRQAEMARVVNELIGRLRDLSMNLRPPMLDEIGLVPALTWHFERYTTRTRVRVSFRHPEAVVARFPAAVEIAAFRIIQEALTNVARHAGVDLVEVELKTDPKYLKLRIEDKGIGFDPKSSPAGRSAGITGMRERALLVGGNLTIESATGAGARLMVIIPLRDPFHAWT